MTSGNSVDLSDRIKIVQAGVIATLYYYFLRGNQDRNNNFL